MDALNKERTEVERPSDHEVVVRRTFDAPKRLVFEAWTTPELLKQWWAPRSMGMQLVGCEVDARTGGTYRFEFAGKDVGSKFAFFGRYVEVDPPNRIVWTNEETGDGSVTTVTLDEQDGKTLLVMRDVYSSKEALDQAGGAEGALPEQFEQLDALLAAQLSSKR